MTNQNHEEDLILNEEQLESAAGGTLPISHVTAYCKACKQKLRCLGVKRIACGMTHIFQCQNAACAEYQIDKTNMDVDWTQ